LDEARKNEQRHDYASKEVTAPAGVAVIRLTQGFNLALPLTPTPSNTLQGVAFGLTDGERRARDDTTK
jgi:hypothetical protein